MSGREHSDVDHDKINHGQADDAMTKNHGAHDASAAHITGESSDDRSMLSLNAQTFDQALRDAEGLVLVDFWAPWCGPCGVISPTLEALALHYTRQKITFCKVNVDESPQLMRAFGLRSVPTVLMLKPNPDGGARVLDALIGAQSASRYQQWVERYVNPPPSLFDRVKGLFS